MNNRQTIGIVPDNLQPLDKTRYDMTQHLEHEIFSASYRFAAPADIIKSYILTPERIMDYFPAARKAYALAPGKCIISAWNGATLLETREISSDGLTLQMEVSSALIFFPPFTAQKIQQQALFSMTEIWQLTPLPQGCQLKKSWGNIKQNRLTFIPIKKAVVNSAIKEEAALVNGWDMAYMKR